MPNKKFFQWMIPSIGITLTLLFFFIHPSAETTKSIVPSTTKSNTELITYIDKYNLLVFNIKHQLRINGYPVVVDYAISSDEKIELLIKINQENTKQTTEKIIQKVGDTIRQNNFDLASFHINVTNYDEPSPTNITSTRLSYNDLIGYIGEKLFAKYNIAFSLQHEVLPKNINITLNLPTNYQTHNVEIRNSILGTIKQHNFNPILFQINLTNSIKTD